MALGKSVRLTLSEADSNFGSLTSDHWGFSEVLDAGSSLQSQLALWMLNYSEHETTGV